MIATEMERLKESIWEVWGMVRVVRFWVCSGVRPVDSLPKMRA